MLDRADFQHIEWVKKEGSDFVFPELEWIKYNSQAEDSKYGHNIGSDVTV